MQKELSFTGIITREDDQYVSLCAELDVASQGDTPEEARAMLLEAAAGYLEACFEDGSPYLRPVPPAEDPRNEDPASVTEVFIFGVEVTVSAQVNAHAEAA